MLGGLAAVPFAGGMAGAGPVPGAEALVLADIQADGPVFSFAPIREPGESVFTAWERQHALWLRDFSHLTWDDLQSRGAA